MKTIAQLKRDAKSGEYKGRMIIRNGNYNIPERLNGWRKIVDSNTKSIFFLNNEGKKSELQLPKATLVEYTDNLLTIYNPGERGEIYTATNGFVRRRNRRKRKHKPSKPRKMAQGYAGLLRQDEQFKRSKHYSVVRLWIYEFLRLLRSA